MDNSIQVRPPLFLLTSSEHCWKCQILQPVIAIGAHEVRQEGEMFAAVLDKGELALLTNVTEMPEAVFKFICARNTRYKQQHSLTAGFTYYANTCECGTNFGDHYLFSEPGGAFFPMTDEDAAAIEIETMPFTEPLKFDSSYGMGIGDHILKHAKRR